MINHKACEVELKGGGRGLFVHVPDSPVMVMELSFRAGKATVDRAKVEAPHIMEHLALGECKYYRKPNQLMAEIERNGGYANAWTSYDDTGYEAECADFEWERVLDLLLKGVSTPIFSQKEFEVESSNVREELMQRGSHHGTKLGLAMDAESGGFGYTYEEGLKSISNITVNDIRSHYKKTHVRGNMRFVIVGQLSDQRQQKIIEMIEKSEIRPGGERVKPLKEAPRGRQRLLYIEDSHVSNLRLYIDFFLLRHTQLKELDALRLLDNLFTGAWDTWLYGEARKRGLTYDVRSGVVRNEGSLVWTVQTQVSEESALKFVDLLVETIKRVLIKGMSLEELHRAKNMAIGRFQRAYQTAGSLTSGYNSDYYYDDSIGFFLQYPERISAVTRKRALGLFKEMIDSRSWLIGVLGQADQDLRQQIQLKLEALWE